MKLFGNFEAVNFYEENMILVTNSGYIYYIYYHTSKSWHKHRNAGNDHITVRNYSDVSKYELVDAMGGIFPKKETDFMRLCNPDQLWIGDMLSLLIEDYSRYLSVSSIYNAIHSFLLESDIKHKTYLMLKKLLDDAVLKLYDNQQVLAEIKELCFTVLGRDIFKKQIGIVDGHDSSSYFWIKPVRVIDHTDTNDLDNVAEMYGAEISIEEDDVAQYLTPFLYKYFDPELQANKRRMLGTWEDDDGNEQASVISGFEWYLTHNYYTFDSVNNILKDIIDTIDALSSMRENEYTKKLKIKRGSAACKLIYSRELNEDQIKEYNANRPKEDDTEVELVMDFYRRFIYRMEYMLKIGREKGYDLISFMGP